MVKFVKNISEYNTPIQHANEVVGIYGVVLSLAVYNGDLYVDGSFTTASGNPSNNVAKWDAYDIIKDYCNY